MARPCDAKFKARDVELVARKTKPASVIAEELGGRGRAFVDGRRLVPSPQGVGFLTSQSAPGGSRLGKRRTGGEFRESGDHDCRCLMDRAGAWETWVNTFSHGCTSGGVGTKPCGIKQLADGIPASAGIAERPFPAGVAAP